MGNVLSFAILTAFIIAFIVAVIFISLYISTRANLIDPSQCPNFDVFEDGGLLVQPNKTVGDRATDCSGSINCEFTVTNLGAAKSKCDTLGGKCVSFSLTPIEGSTDLLMQTGVTDAPSNTVIEGTNFYRAFT